MTSVPVRRRTLLAGSLLAGAIGLNALAQGSDKPITLVVPNAAGGAADSLARSFADEMSRRLRQTVIVENQGGASGAIAAQKVLRSAPDGHRHNDDIARLAPFV